jgi:hypothetical protein
MWATNEVSNSYTVYTETVKKSVGRCVKKIARKEPNSREGSVPPSLEFVPPLVGESQW